MYQVIYLSNILDRIKANDKLSCVRKVKEIIEKFKSYLSDDGVFGLCYLYYYFDDELVNSTPYNILNPDLRREYFPEGKGELGSEYSYFSFNGFNDIKGRGRAKNRDALMVVRK